ncbi:hypothetical protein KY290_002538 [Solanum tuberosum]|uniref:DNA-directed RNA polymerase II n=1 Tax=Solanum tuberosum TaxID=4113 RepID=A0ABQ7WSJ2_SOLTU|nr:hypothetical protein KY290_002538 [Solanum tuberosum]
MDVNGSAMEVDVVNVSPCLASFVDDGTVESHRYFLARKTMLEMLKDRGFAIPNSEIDTTLQEFREKYGQRPDAERLRISAMHRTDLTNKAMSEIWGMSEKDSSILGDVTNWCSVDSLVSGVLCDKKLPSKFKGDLTLLLILWFLALHSFLLVVMSAYTLPSQDPAFGNNLRSAYTLPSQDPTFGNNLRSAYTLPSQDLTLWDSIGLPMEIGGSAEFNKTKLRSQESCCINWLESSAYWKMVLVIFCGPNSVKMNVIRSILSQIMNKESLSRLILIIENPMTNPAMKVVEDSPFKTEIFQITDLLVNITKHVLKPKHELLTNTEKEQLLKKYNLEDKQLPRMSQKDAIARYYGLEKGQVVKVTYSNEIIETHIALTSYFCASRGDGGYSNLLNLTMLLC